MIITSPLLSLSKNTIIYISSKDGCDETGLGTLESPYQTLSKAISLLNSLYIHPNIIATIKLSDGIYKCNTDLPIYSNIRISGSSKTSCLILFDSNQGFILNPMSSMSITNLKMKSESNRKGSAFTCLDRSKLVIESEFVLESFDKAIQSFNSILELSNCKLQHNNYSITSENSILSLESVTIYDNIKGIFSEFNSILRSKNCIFNNNQNAVYLNKRSCGYLDNCEFNNNGVISNPKFSTRDTLNLGNYGSYIYSY